MIKIDTTNHILKGNASSSKACRLTIQQSLFKVTECDYGSCSFGGIYQPNIPLTFSNTLNNFYIFSYFYEKIIGVGGKEKVSLDQIKLLNDQVCGGDYESLLLTDEEKKNVEDDSNLCLELSFIGVLLKNYGLSGDREVTLVKKIAGVETGWCLGAALRMVDENIDNCKG